MLTEYIAAMLSFPTVIFTVPMGVAVLYWGSVLSGIADAEAFDGAFDGALDGGALDGPLQRVDLLGGSEARDGVGGRIGAAQLAIAEHA